MEVFVSKLCPDITKYLPCWMSHFRKAELRQPTGQRQDSQTKISIGPILFLYYEESLVSSNLNSKQLSFHGAHPNVHMQYGKSLKNILLEYFYLALA